MASLPSALSQIKLVFTNKVVRNCKDSSALTELNRLCKSSAGMRMKKRKLLPVRGPLSNKVRAT